MHTALARFEIAADKAGPRLMNFACSDAVDIFGQRPDGVPGRCHLHQPRHPVPRHGQQKNAMALPLKKGANQVVLVAQEMTAAAPPRPS